MTDKELEAIEERRRAVPWPHDIKGSAERSAFGIWSFGPFDPHSEGDAVFHARAADDVSALVEALKDARSCARVAFLAMQGDRAACAALACAKNDENNPRPWLFDST